MKKDKVEVTEEEFETVELVEVPVIAPLTLEFNREDLNALRDKINEIILALTS